jgi:glycosyltransferase involved in cell wall biosynthesis
MTSRPLRGAVGQTLNIEIAVVAATHNRADRLAALLDALRAQTIGSTRFEVVIVDDASSDGTREVLADAAQRGDLALTVLRHDVSRGPASARNAGWRTASAPLVAFTDDDCRPSPAWLEAGIRAMVATANGTGEAIVQGLTEPDPWEADRLGPFTRSLNVPKLDHWYATANMFYARATLERLGGFDEETFTRPGGEDTDLAWRAIGEGVPTTFSDEARVWHAVHELGPLKRLRFATRWDETMAVFGRYPELRRQTLIRGLFWKESHYHLARTVAGLLLPGRLRLIGAYFALRYALLLWRRAHWHGDGKGGGPLLVPYYLAENAIELATAARGAARYRTPVL